MNGIWWLKCKLVFIFFSCPIMRKREREAYNCVIWQMVPLLKVQSHLIDGLLIGSSKSVSFKVVPLYGSPLMFHNATACASHCWNIEINALTVSQLTISRTQIISPNSRFPTTVIYIIKVGTCQNLSATYISNFHFSISKQSN